MRQNAFVAEAPLGERRPTTLPDHIAELWRKRSKGKRKDRKKKEGKWKEKRGEGHPSPEH